MGRRPKFYDMKKEFMKNIIKQPDGCWLWKLKVFRFRINFGYESIVLNPRRYCAYIHGYNIQVSRHVKNACINPNCVNPEHTVLKHNGKPISKHTPFYLTFDDMKMGSNLARQYYGRTMAEMREARAATHNLMKMIKREPAMMQIEHIVNKYDVGPYFAKRARELTLEEYEELREDKYDTGDTPLDETGEEMLPEAQLFR